MKVLPGTMQADLNVGVTTHCHCWLVIRVDGTQMGFTDHDEDMTFEGTVFHAETGLTASSLQTNAGVSTGNLDVSGAISSDSITAADIAAGSYDNAAVTVWRVDWTNVENRVILLAGTLGEVTRGDIDFMAEIRGINHFMTQPNGKQYNSHCDATLGDARCTIDLATFPNATLPATVALVGSSRVFVVTDPAIVALTDGWFSNGRVLWLTGDNAGETMEVRNSVEATGTQTQFELWEGMPKPIKTGDACSCVVGCDKTIQTCKAKFNNVANFRGYPRIPGLDATQFYVRNGSGNTGGSLYGQSIGLIDV